MADITTRGGDCEPHEAEGGYEVGYGKPPKEHQFKKGQSGNPNGAPKKAKKQLETGDIGELIAAKLLSEVTVKEGGEHKEMTLLEALTSRYLTVLTGVKTTREVKTALELLDKFGVFQILNRQIDLPATGPWTPELEAKLQKAFEEFADFIEPEPAADGNQAGPSPTYNAGQADDGSGEHDNDDEF